MAGRLRCEYGAGVECETSYELRKVEVGGRRVGVNEGKEIREKGGLRLYTLPPMIIGDMFDESVEREFGDVVGDGAERRIRTMRC